MNLLPCREALLEVIDVWFHQQHHRSDLSDDDRQEEECCWKIFHRYNSFESTFESIEDAVIKTEDELTFEIVSPTTEEELDDDCCSLQSTAVLIRNGPIQSDYIFRNMFVHYGSTLLITAACYLGAVAVTGVAAVWSFIGEFHILFLTSSYSLLTE